MMIPRNTFGLNLFDDMFRDPFFNIQQTSHAMKTDIQQKNGNYLLDIDLPGFKKEDIKAELNNGYLTVSATKNESNEQKDDRYIRRERYYGECSRSFYVGDAVTMEDIKAGYKDGILHIEFPDKEEKYIEQKSKYIPIE